MNVDRKGLAVLAQVEVGAGWVKALEARTRDLLSARIATGVMKDTVCVMVRTNHDILRVLDPDESVLGMLFSNDAMASLAHVVIGTHGALVPIAVDLAIAQVAGGVVHDRDGRWRRWRRDWATRRTAMMARIRTESPGMRMMEVMRRELGSGMIRPRFLTAILAMTAAALLMMSTVMRERRERRRHMMRRRAMMVRRRPVVATRGIVDSVDHNMAGFLEFEELVLRIMLVALGVDAIIAHVVINTVQAFVAAANDGLVAYIAEGVVLDRLGCRSRSISRRRCRAA
jgi:hypothetical protein